MSLPNETLGVLVSIDHINDWVASMNTATSDISAKAWQLRQSFRGLHLRTHPDNDKAANQIALLGLDEVVMNDGTRYSGLTLPLTADITASGAAGLDTGSRTASTWYEAWLIGKSSTKAVSDLRLMLHRAKDYYLDQSFTTNDTQSGLRDSSADTKKAQGVTFATSGKVEFVDVNLRKAAAPTGNIWFTIEADNSGSPSGTPLATSDKLNIANVSTSFQTVRFVFRSPYSVTASTQYHLVFQGDFTISGTNYIDWRGNSTGGYSGGQGKTFDGASTWSAIGGTGFDFWFKLYVTRNDTALTYPAGYDESARLGFVYNSSGNALIYFVQNDRRVMSVASAALATGLTATYFTLVDMSILVPPIPVISSTWLMMNTTGGAINDVSADLGTVVLHTVCPTASAYGDSVVRVPIEFQSAYVKVSAGAGDFYYHGYEW